jgi:hypothetical protein
VLGCGLHYAAATATALAQDDAPTDESRRRREDLEASAHSSGYGAVRSDLHNHNEKIDVSEPTDVLNDNAL